MAPSPSPNEHSTYVGPWRVDLATRPGVPRLLAQTRLARTIAIALDAAGALRPASIGLILTGDSELAGLNAVHMGKTGPTDVLSFPLLPAAAFPPQPGSPRGPQTRPRTRPQTTGGRGDGPATVDFVLPPGRRLHLGDIVVSVERAIEQAEAGRGGQTGDVRWDAADELRLLVIHGTLHVCGWDHAEPAEETSMRALEQRLLAWRTLA
jgi:probable rRNA maturation factor